MNAAHAREPWEGRIVEGKYPLLELVGSGPRGSVFRTEFSGKNGPQKAAIKLIPVEQAGVQDQLDRLRLATQLSNSHLIKIFEAGQCQIQREPAIYVVMEYAEENLAQVLPSRALTASEVRQMLPPLLEALSYLHSQGLVHGHVQPSNILAVGDMLKLSTDCVRQAGSTDRLQPGKSGSPAPEAAKNTSASDIWSLGATLVAALATESRGQPSEQELTMVPISIPEPFRRIARECLQPNASDRCTLEQIKVWLDVNQNQPPPVESSAPPPSRGVGVKIAVGAALVFAAVFGLRQMRSTPSGSRHQAPVSQSSTQSAPASPATAQQGSVPGAVAEQVLPNVSQGARNTIQGKIRVAVRVSVDATGNVTDAKLTSPGPSKYFANQALQSARRWKFKPPQTDGQPTPSAWLLKYQFGRAGTEVLPAPVR